MPGEKKTKVFSLFLFLFPSPSLFFSLHICLCTCIYVFMYMFIYIICVFIKELNACKHIIYLSILIIYIHVYEPIITIKLNMYLHNITLIEILCKHIFLFLF